MAKPAVRRLEGNKWLLVFASEEETCGVLHSRLSILKGFHYSLWRWTQLGCLDKQRNGYGKWRIKIFSVPLLAWCPAVFKEIGNAVGELTAVDRSNLAWRNLEALRLLV
uniref:DUF4283 domain-containing protein n=1 Tax=Nelumbo nucifera TaxID=4432 RepID=A0A822ZLF6_NELNU|nr:TPA_asm: hypothetical protein HUJ06_003813 [Nelumbo nucifera]